MSDKVEKQQQPKAEKAAAAIEEEKQPEVFPVDFNEWRAGQSPMRKTLLAGMAYHVRVAGLLLEKRAPSDWEQAFTEFQKAKD